MKKIVTITLLTSFLFGCATSYQKTGITGGYEDYDYGDGKFKVIFLGNGYTATAKVKEYAYYRANELCKGKNYQTISEKIQDRGVLAFPKAEIIVQCDK